MTLDEMTALTVSHWRTHFRKMVKNWPAGELHKQATAAAKLTQMEMDTLTLIGVDPAIAWSDCKTLFCFAPPPD